jgi:hypothetical protein
MRDQSGTQEIRKERPILFNAEMVRAILEGRKTQTRRRLHPQPDDYHILPERASVLSWVDVEAHAFHEGAVAHFYYTMGESENYTCKFGRVGDRMMVWNGLRDLFSLEITEIRVERLNDIDRGDAMEEGCPFPNMADGPDPREWFSDLWRSIYGDGSWDENPWVWVIEFRRVEEGQS